MADIFPADHSHDLNVKHYLARGLKDIRSGKGTTQRFIANKLGVPFQRINKYESGDNAMSAATLYQIASILNVDVDSFYEGLIRPESAYGIENGPIP